MLAVMLTACGGGTSSTPATTEAPAVAPAPAAQGAILSDLLKDWQEQKDSMMKLADAMPEDKFGYKSTPAQRSYGEHIMHAALVNVDLLKLVGGKAAAPTFTAESAKSKGDILAALAASYDYGTAHLQEQTEATIGQQQEASWLGASTRARMFWTPAVPHDGRVWTDGRLPAPERHRASGQPRRMSASASPPDTDRAAHHEIGSPAARR